MSQDGKMSVLIERSKSLPPKSIWADAFTVEPLDGDRNIFEATFGDPFSGISERVVFNALLLRMGMEPFTEYLANFALPAGSPAKPTRHWQRASSYLFANHIVPSRLGDYGETMFEHFLLADWAAEVKPKSAKAAKFTHSTVPSTAVIGIYTTLEIQIRLLYELIEKMGIKK